MISLNNADDIVFLALCVWREARGESRLCKIAVAHSIMNRVNNPKWWGRTIMEVLFKKWQYSSLTDPNDRQLTKWPVKDSVWNECLYAAHDVICGLVENPVPGADSYFDVSIPAPKWAEPKMFVAQIDRIRFFNVDMDYEEQI